MDNPVDDTIAPTSNFGPRLDDGDTNPLDELKPVVVAPGVSIDPQVAKEILRNTAEPRGTPFNQILDPTYDTRFGGGIVDAFRALPADLGVIDAVWVTNRFDDDLFAIAPAPSAAPVSQKFNGNPHATGGRREPVGIAVDGDRLRRGWQRLRRGLARQAEHDADVDLSDPIYLISFLFVAEDPPDAPFPNCDFAVAPLGCVSTACP